MAQSGRGVLKGLMLLAVGTLIFGIPSYGDTHAIHTVIYDYNFVGDSFYGIDNVGNFVANLTGDSSNYPADGCGGVLNPSSCYETYYVRTQRTIFSLTPPNLQYDDGVGCVPNVGPFVVVSGGVCNNGYEILGVERSAFTPFPEVWVGRDGAGFINFGFFGGAFINHLGDAVYLDPGGELGEGIRTLYWVEDLSTSITPEPGTLFLVGSGGLMLLGLLIRRPVGKGKQLHREQCLP